MTRISSLGISGSIALLLSGSALPGALAPAQVEQTLQQGQRDVIVILRDQMANLPPARRAMGARAAALAASQSSVLASLPATHGRKVKSFATINAFAATLTATEVAQLSGHPMVQAIVPDRVIKSLPHSQRHEPGAASGAAGSAGFAPTDGGLCNTLEPEALQVTNAAFADPSTPQAQQLRDGNGQFVTGKGVKVAFLADTVDPNNPGFIRPDGSHVFIDYQDFTGDPAGTPGSGGEAFGDASSIAAQDLPNGKPLLFDISQFIGPTYPLPSPCNIRIRGMAPGASLVGLVVFSSAGSTTTSNFVQAIEYAVQHDDVDVINESFGGSPFPDNANDPISLANNAAVRAGVVVTVSSGDAGTTGTLESPASESSVIAVGATTTYRVYAQTADGIIPLTKNKGYLSNNISGLSSAGFSQKNARVVDVVAPGELGWSLCSLNQALFADCGDYTAAAAPAAIEVFGGTSESSPLTAGLAALVIQAYRSTHGGADPTPDLVKRIIMGSATDLGAPSVEQGAGLINAFAAVNLALSVSDGYGHPKARGDGFLSLPSSAHIIATAGKDEAPSFILTNASAITQYLTPALETLVPFETHTVTVKSDPTTEPIFLNAFGNKRVYMTKTFTVSDKTEQLDVAIAFKNSLSAANNPPLVLLGLLDPSGKMAAYSEPQGLGSGYSHVDVVKPQPGTWKAIIYTRTTGVVGSYAGPVQFTWSLQHFVPMGSVSPSHLTLAPGASAELTAQFDMPAQPGDLAAAIRFDKSPGAASGTLPEIPVSLRTLVETNSNGGNFTGTLTGGNSRAGSGPYQTFVFDVPAGLRDMNLTLEVADAGYPLVGFFIDPQGMELSVGPNQDPADGTAQFALQLAHYSPQAGRWKFVLVQDFSTSGNQTSLPFTARIGFNAAQIRAPKLPNDAAILVSASGKPVTVPVKITNTAPIAKLYFADARLNAQAVTQLPPQPCSTATTLPGACGVFLLPTQVSSAAFVAQSTVPINMDALSDVGEGVAFTGTPDIYARPIAPNTVAAFISEPEVPYSAWFVSPSQRGPYGASGAPTVPVNTAALVLMQPFDTSVSADSGDIWLDFVQNTNTFNPLTLASGESGTITVTIAPDPSLVGKTVTGFIYVDTFDLNVFTGDEVVRIPYTYTVAP